MLDNNLFLDEIGIELETTLFNGGSGDEAFPQGTLD